MASNEARKKAAKLYQKEHPGISYPEALRIVSREHVAPLAAVVSSNTKGKFVRCNLEEAALGGDGPHCGIAGATGSGKTNLLAAMAGSILQSPPTRGVEIVYVTDRSVHPQFSGVTDTVVAHADLKSYLVDLLGSREEQLRERGWLHNRGEGADPLPAVVVMVDDPPWARRNRECSTDIPAGPALRTGRTLDVHLVVTWQTPPDARGRLLWLPTELDPHLSSVIHLQGRGRGTWNRRNSADKHTNIAVPPAETFQRDTA